MHPLLLKFGPLTIYSYGVMVAVGFGLATILICREADKFSIEKDKVIDLAILILISGIAGARFLYVMLNAGYYIARPLEILGLSKGGLVWYGGFLSAALASIFYIRRKRMNFWNVADLIAPYIALAQGAGRIGCFLNGCCYGIETHSGYPLAVAFPGERVFRHPTQIYSSILLILIFLILRFGQERRRFTGEIFLGYCALYSAKRFIIEFLRGDNPRIFYCLTLSQVISLAVLTGSLIIFLYRMARWKKRHSDLK